MSKHPSHQCKVIFVRLSISIKFYQFLPNSNLKYVKPSSSGKVKASRQVESFLYSECLEKGLTR